MLCRLDILRFDPVPFFDPAVLGALFLEPVIFPAVRPRVFLARCDFDAARLGDLAMTNSFAFHSVMPTNRQDKFVVFLWPHAAAGAYGEPPIGRGGRSHSGTSNIPRVMPCPTAANVNG